MAPSLMVLMGRVGWWALRWLQPLAERFSEAEQAVDDRQLAAA
jgi:hypothetical protein